MIEEPRDPPRTWRGTLSHFGPGLVITASVVGSGELIMTPKLGAQAGFGLLWFIILGCVLKVFVQIELGRIAVSKGMTTLEIMDAVPGPRLRVSWMVWFWLVMYLAVLFQVGGIIGGVGLVFSAAGSPLSPGTWAVIVSASCSLLLVLGRYKLLERLCTAQVVLFTITTVVGVCALQRTEFAISWGHVAGGFRFALPADLTTAFACFGIIGVGAAELIYYPYWCLEKGYARFAGAAEDTRAWRERARGWLRVMSADAWVSMAIYTLATVAFFLLGAAVLKGKGMQVTDRELIQTLSHMYSSAFGPWGFWVFLVGAFFVLYSTMFSATAGKARLLADVSGLLRLVRFRDAEHRQRFIRASCGLLPLVSAAIYLVWPKPVRLVMIGGLAQALMLPFLASAALYFRYRGVAPDLRPGAAWTAVLWVASLAFAALGGYELFQNARAVLGR